MNKDFKIAIKVYLIIFFSIIIYFSSLFVIYGYDQLAEKDILNNKITTKSILGSNGISYWAFSHLIMYMILGYLLPNHFIILTIVGIVWELFETVVGYLTMPKDIKKEGKRKITGEENIEYMNWWSGSIKDIIFNTIGFLIGYTLNKTIKNKNSVNNNNSIKED